MGALILIALVLLYAEIIVPLFRGTRLLPHLRTPLPEEEQVEKAKATAAMMEDQADAFDDLASAAERQRAARQRMQGRTKSNDSDIA